MALISRSMGFISELADQIEDSKAYTCDVMDTENIKGVFETIKEDLGIVDTLIYSASSRFKAQGINLKLSYKLIEDMMIISHFLNLYFLILLFN